MPTISTPSVADGSSSAATVSRSRRRALDAFGLVLVLALAVKLVAPDLLSTPAVSAWFTVFVAISVQAAPYVALGVAVSTILAVAVPASFFQRALPRRQMFAVPVAGLAGVALPGCECGSVPVAATLMRRGVSPGAAVAFLLSAPAINPIVLVATAVAFPGQPIVVAARAAASLATAVIMGWLWQRLGRGIPLPARHDHDGSRRLEHARAVAVHDLMQTLGFLALGAAAAATLNVTVPRSVLAHLSGSEPVAIVTLAFLAIVLALCSEADAFVAASLTQFPLVARLTFMVVGPAVDLKLIAMQTGTFGRRFALRFAPVVAVTAVLCATVVGTVLL